jgi:caffeoyl-CoA O-methyltransferase
MKIDLLPNHFELLHDFSESIVYENFNDDETKLFASMKKLESDLNFPAVKNDVGVFLSFITNSINAKSVFEFGSGYGQSAFWFLKNAPLLEKIVLTEKREDFLNFFNQLSWPQSWKNKIEYNNNNAFSILENNLNHDIYFCDGEKFAYLDFVKFLNGKIKKDALVIIDNAFWKGSFLETHPDISKKSSQSIKELHEYFKTNKDWHVSFIPYLDGLLLLKNKA